MWAQAEYGDDAVKAMRKREADERRAAGQQLGDPNQTPLGVKQVPPPPPLGAPGDSPGFPGVAVCPRLFRAVAMSLRIPPGCCSGGVCPLEALPYCRCLHGRTGANARSCERQMPGPWKSCEKQTPGAVEGRRAGLWQTGARGCARDTERSVFGRSHVCSSGARFHVSGARCHVSVARHARVAA